MPEQLDGKGRTIANAQTRDGLVRILQATRGLKQTAEVSHAELTILRDATRRPSPVTAASDGRRASLHAVKPGL